MHKMLGLFKEFTSLVLLVIMGYFGLIGIEGFLGLGFKLFY